MGEQIRKAWDKSAIPLYIAIAAVMTMSCGYAIRAQQDLDVTVQVAKVQAKERAALKRAHKLELKTLKAENTRLTDTIASLARKSADNTKTAIEQKVEK